MRLMIVGPQGAGKGTQAALLCADLEIPHVSTGDLFRENISGGTELGKLAQQYTDSGALVPDDVTQQMVADRLRKPDAEPGFLLDGFPRNLSQAQWLSGHLTEHGHDIDVVVLLQAPDDVLIERMLARGRADDTTDAIKLRLGIYHSETAPLVEYYGERVVPIDGTGAVDEVHQRVMDAVGRPTADTGTVASSS